nr:hypothetical protein CFP56_74687 [Quercus suber]
MEYSHVGRTIKQLQSKLQMLEKQPSSMETANKIRDVCKALNVWLDVESTIWKQRSRNFWLTDGDRNTSFFHTKATNQKQCNVILDICDLDGVWQDDEQ